MISSINIVIELCCLISAIYWLRNDRTKFSSTTITYLVIVCITEISGILWTKTIHTSNAWIYNIFIIFEATYISYGLYVALKVFSKKAGLFCTLAFTIFLITYLIECNAHGFFRFNSKAVLVESILFVIISLYYFYLLIKDRAPINLKYSAIFWWVAGVYAYYFGGTLYNLILQHSISSNMVLTYIMVFLNLLLYSIWTYSFICNSRQLN